MKAAALRFIPAPFLRKVRARRLERAVSAFPPREATREFSGVRLTLHIADPLAEAWYDHDISELTEIVSLREAGIGEGARVFYFGAHQCVFPLVISDLVGPSGSVIAVEPDAHNFRVGERNRVLNRADNLTIVNAAVSDATGTVTFLRGLTGRVDSGGNRARPTVSVRSVTIDELADEYGPPQAVIIDVEGHEQAALAGATRTLDARCATFSIEVHTGCGLELAGGTPGRVLAYFLDRDYRLVIPRTSVPYEADHFAFLASPPSHPRP